MGGLPKNNTFKRGNGVDWEKGVEYEAFKNHKNQDSLETLPEVQFEGSPADWQDQIDLSEIEYKKVKGAAWRMLTKCYNIWSGRLGCITATKHHINLKQSTRPAPQMTYR